MNRTSFAAALLIGVIASGCANLPELDVCGNGLVDEREDCDGNTTKAADGSTVSCGAPNQPRGCRWTCDVSDPQHPGACPVGYVCSPSDGICRAPSGAYTQVVTLPFNAARLDVTDLDGDGQKDLFAGEDSAATAVFFTDKGASTTTLTLPPLNYAASGSITSSANSDLVAFSQSQNGDSGMLVLDGAQRAFSPASFSSFPVKSDTIVLPYYDENKNELLALQGTSLLGYSVNYANPHTYATLSAPPSLPFGRVGAFSSGLAVAFAVNHRIQLLFPAYGSGQLDWSATVSLPQGAGKITNFWLQDINSDGALDVAIVTECIKTACPAGYVVYGIPNGGGPGDLLFETSTGASSTSLEAEPLPATSFGPTLGIMDLDLDGIPDLVTAQGIAVGACSSPPCFVKSFEMATTFDSYTLDSVVFADFNGDGRPDVLAGSSFQSGLQFVLTAGSGVFNKSIIPTTGPTSHFVVGDFDGDLFPDVAFAESLSKDEWQVDFVFGGRGAEPTGPIVRGPFGPITQLVANPNILTGGMTERSDLLAVTGNGEDKTIAVFPGSADREFFSPYFFVANDTVQTPSYAVVGGFDATDPRGDVACLTSGADERRVWLLASQKNGTLASAAAAAKAPSAIGPSAAMVVVPGAAGTDRVALLSPPLAGKQSALVLATSPHGRFEFGDPLLFDGSVVTQFFGFSQQTNGPAMGLTLAPPTLPVCVADLDGDKRLDLAVITQAYEGTGMGTGSVLVFWGNADGSFTPPATVATSSRDAPALLACVHAHATEEAQLAVVTSSGVRVLACDNARTCAYDSEPVVKISLDSTGDAPLRKKRGNTASRGGSIWSGITTIAAGDLTGDGIDDIVISGFDENYGSLTAVLSGVPTIP